MPSRYLKSNNQMIKESVNAVTKLLIQIDTINNFIIGKFTGRGCCTMFYIWNFYRVSYTFILLLFIIFTYYLFQENIQISARSYFDKKDHLWLFATSKFNHSVTFINILIFKLKILHLILN